VLKKPAKQIICALTLLAGFAVPLPREINAAAIGYQAVDEFAKFRFNVDSRYILKDQALPAAEINVPEKKLLAVLTSTRAYFAKFSAEDPVVTREGILGTQGVKVSEVLKTLDFMVQVLQEDLALNRPTRLRDPKFINANFRVINWLPYNPKDPQQTQKLRITRYAVFVESGSRQKTAVYNTALYALPDTAQQDSFYKRYTKQDIVAGIYEPGGKEFGRVQPLAYLSREGFEEALMQGTILVKFNDGSSAYFNVDRNNGIAYDRALRPRAQKRYWYFRQVRAIKGYGNKIQNKIDIEPGVTFAGDVFNIGLGRIVVLEHEVQGKKSLTLGVVADTGGAFLPNLYQLDYLAGTFPNRQEFFRQTYRMPEYARAYFLIKK
jgi:hypothetical protein